MSYAIYTEWNDYYSKGWENVGRQTLEQSCTCGNEAEGYNMSNNGYCEKCGFAEDSAEPIYNYAYPLEAQPTDENILEVIKRTNLTIMFKTEEDKYYLALCGCGMDLSQDIALAYIIMGEMIPEDLIKSVCTQKDLSVSGEDWDLLKNSIIKQSENYIFQLQNTIKNWSVKPSN